MGHRELKRVALDFEWPLKKAWKGYINPYPGRVECAHCEGTGLNPASKQIADDFYDNDNWGSSRASRAWHKNITQDEVDALVAAGRLWDFTRVPRSDEQREVVRLKKEAGGNSWLPYENGYRPTAEEVNSNHRKISTLGGHDSINRLILIETRCKRLGVWGHCTICKGKGRKFPKGVSRHKYNAWREYEPPAGPGYQLWETVSEGSPVSPVFKTAEELAAWCEPNTNLFAKEKTSRDIWLQMFEEEGGVDAGSMLIGTSGGYFGALANMPAGA